MPYKDFMVYFYKSFGRKWGRLGMILFFIGVSAGHLKAQTYGVNLITNPGAETVPVTIANPGTGLPWVDRGNLGWCTTCADNGVWYLPDSSFYPTPQHNDNGAHQAHSGNYFFSTGVNSIPGAGQSGMLQQTVNLATSGLANLDLVFNISAWVATDGLNGLGSGDELEVTMEFRDNMENVVEISDQVFDPVSTTDINWNNLTDVVNVTAAEGVTHVLVTLKATNNNTVSTIQGYFDDISLTASNPLPVTLVDFHAVRQPDQTNELYWETAQEENSSYTEVQRSGDGQRFASIGKVAAAGNSSLPRNYTYTDAAPPAGNDYYRLRMVDLDGSARYSKIVLVNGGLPGKNITVFSNPFHDRLEVHIPSGGAERLVLTLMDATGRVCLRQPYTTQVGDNFVDLNPPSGLAAGVYLLQVTGSVTNKTVRVVKN